MSPGGKSSNLKEHWDNVYLNKPEEKLGWYETDLSPALKLISETGLKKSSRILIVGAGTTTLIDSLLKEGYSKLIATDISEAALNKLENKHGSKIIRYIADDLSCPVSLLSLKPVDLWIDRAVLHFLFEKSEQDVYFDLLKSKVKPGGFVILAEFSLDGAEKCSGLPVFRYSAEMLSERLGTDYTLIDSFEYTYINPSGGERPYIYTLFRKK
jgi:ubiquinone/menaquinone biosynthesis C-methylase UbiE